MNRQRLIGWTAMALSVFSAPALSQPASPAPAAPAAPPSWLTRPTAIDVQRVYPPDALKQALGGVARLQCTVTAQGTLDACKVSGEDPANAGFGQAALQLAPLFKMIPQAALTGTKVTIPIRFGSTPATPTPVSWVRLPTSDDIVKVYPKPALDAAIDGAATIGCKVADGGRLEDCRIVSETPPNNGFGPAALKLAPLFQLSRGGGMITVPIVFSAR